MGKYVFVFLVSLDFSLKFGCFLMGMCNLGFGTSWECKESTRLLGHDMSIFEVFVETQEFVS